MDKIFNMRWVCAVCLKVIHAPLKVTRRWVQCGGPHWEIATAIGPRHCDRDMLIAGEPKVDRWGLSGQGQGALIDPVDNLIRA